MRRYRGSVLLLLLLLPLLSVNAADGGKLRVGVLKFGTVNWALNVIREQGLATAEGVDLEVVPLANKNATAVALQGGAADIIVTDWIWVSRQRAEGNQYTFAPYSLAVGALMVRPDASIVSIGDLAGKRLGIAGGPVDKNWLLLRAYGNKTLNQDLTEILDPNFAAPPLLNKLMQKGDLDAVLNFWHFTARLKAAGMQELISVKEILPALGVEGEVPLLGWVFDEAWGDQNRTLVEGFLRAARQAQQHMVDSDELWSGLLRPMTKAKDEVTLTALRDGYRAGVPSQFGAAEIAVAEQVFAILAELGGEKLIGKSTTLDPGTFWPGYSF